VSCEVFKSNVTETMEYKEIERALVIAVSIGLYE
jgi:hypothetical protein